MRSNWLMSNRCRNNQVLRIHLSSSLGQCVAYFRAEPDGLGIMC